MPTQDISRSIFDARKHYTGVRMQQGRVLVDDDWNEHASITAEDQRLTRIDVIGPAGTPDAGFLIEPNAAPVAAADPVDFTIRAGTFYLGGLRLELEQDETLRMQHDWIRVSASLPPRPTAQRDDLVYLEVYEQPVSASEDNEIYEPALGGPDSGTRVRVVGRVAVVPNVASTECAVAWQSATAAWAAAGDGTIDADRELASDARLSLAFVGGTPPADPCAPPLAGGYLGAENQAIRVELLGPTSLAWSFDNGAPLYRVALSNGGGTVTMITPPRDEMHWPLVGQTVEIIPTGALLPNGQRPAERRGTFTTVSTSYDPLTLRFDVLPVVPPVQSASVQPPAPAPPAWGFGEEWRSRSDSGVLATAGNYAYLRVWNTGDASSAIVNTNPATLGNTGIQVTVSGTSIRDGDYWIINARPGATPQISPWELQSATGRARNGIRRYRTPLAIIRWSPQVDGTITMTRLEDCRVPFRPLTRQQNCCRFRVGDEAHSFGDFSSIQAAVTALPPEGGEICVLPGEYTERVSLANRRNIEISGCGAKTRVLEPATGAGAVFTVQDSADVVIRSLAIVATTGEGVHIERSAGVAAGDSSRISVKNLTIQVRDRSAIMVRGSPQLVDICDNRITVVELLAPMSATSEVGKWAAITAGIDESRIERNQVHVLATSTMPVMAFGGIHLLGLSDRVTVRGNQIVRGSGNGITLGSTVVVPAGTTTPTGPTEPPGSTIIVDGNGCLHVGIVDTGGGTAPMVPISEGRLSEIQILDNEILVAGANGIGVIQYFDLSGGGGEFITVDRLLIEGNRIRGCLRLEPLEPPPELLGDVGHGGISLADGEHVVIRGNQIERNGRSHVDPVCGIFVLRAEGLVIEQNHVLENGFVTGELGGTLTMGHRGGIVIVRVVPGTVMTGIHTTLPWFSSASALHALRVHDNVVVHPIGRALFVVGIGSMSVEGNQLTSRGTNFPNFLGLLIQIIIAVLRPGNTPADVAQLSMLLLELISGRTVTILNAGISSELLALIALIQTQKATLVAGSMASAIASPFVADRSFALLTQLAVLTLMGGNVLFTDNQVRLDLLAGQQVFALASVVIVSLDEVSCNDNQFECVFPGGDFIVADVVAAGWSVSLQSNRMEEFPSRALLSGATYAAMNTTTGNQGTHCFYVRSPDSRLRVAHSNRSFVGTFVPAWCDWIPDQGRSTDTPTTTTGPIGTTPGVPVGTSGPGSLILFP